MIWLRMLKKVIFKFLGFLLLSCVLLFIQPVSTLAQSGESLFQKALLMSRQGNFPEALSLWDRYIQLFPTDASAVSNRGNVLLALGEPERAIDDQTRAIELMPSDPDPHLNRGIAEEALQYWNQAELDYIWILDRFPSDSSALYNLGNLRGSQGDWQQAEVLFNKAALAKPDFALARSSKALASYELGKLDEVEAELRQLIRRYPMFADARAAFSAMLWREGCFGEAESNWEAAVGLDSRYREAEWLLNIRRWPPGPTADLMSFLSLDSL